MRGTGPAVEVWAEALGAQKGAEAEGCGGGGSEVCEKEYMGVVRIQREHHGVPHPLPRPGPLDYREYRRSPPQTTHTHWLRAAGVVLGQARRGSVMDPRGPERGAESYEGYSV